MLELCDASYIDSETGLTWLSYQDWFLFGLCNLCECADDDIGSDLISIIVQLNTTDKGYLYYSKFVDIEGPDKYRELLLHFLDRAGLLEHGTSIRHSWLTDEGKQLAKELTNEINTKAHNEAI